MSNKFAWLIVLFSIVIACLFSWQWFGEQNRTYTLTIATGAKDGEYYAFGQALAKVVASHQSEIRLKIVETQGSLQNQELLEKNQVQLALLQSDVSLKPTTRAISILFPEMFHLIATQQSQIGSVDDLKGKRVAIPPQGSGSYRLFWTLLSHYGLSKTDIRPVILPSAQAYTALRQGKIDALFRVIALGNDQVSQLLQDSQIKLVPIEQGAALQLFQPNLEVSQIPKGTYNGGIPIPDRNLPVVAVRSILVTRSDLPQMIIYKLTRILFETRNELVRYNPQAAAIVPPSSTQKMGLPFHEGAEKYYNRDRPYFFVEYADLLGLLLSIAVLCTSGFWQLRLWYQGKQKNRADKYNLEILKLIERIDSTEDLKELAIVRSHLFKIFEKVVIDLDRDQITPESFQSFAFTWEVAMRSIRHREILLTSLEKAEGLPRASGGRRQVFKAGGAGKEGF
ncbi:MAG: TAXI family TRAP transporter solute-binding subunit [Waterburya sp.]